MHFSRSKSTLDSLKRVFNVFRRKPSLSAPDYEFTGTINRRFLTNQNARTI